jgi:hypothetical protein
MANHAKPPVGELTRLLLMEDGASFEASAGMSDPPADDVSSHSQGASSAVTLSAKTVPSPDLNVLLALIRCHPGLKITISY